MLTGFGGSSSDGDVNIFRIAPLLTGGCWRHEGGVAQQRKIKRLVVYLLILLKLKNSHELCFVS